VEVDLCGHATLAAAHIFYEQLGYEGKQIRFWSRSGWLSVAREDDGRLTLDFPADPPVKVDEVPAGIFEGLGVGPREVWRGRFDFMVELDSAEQVQDLKPDFRSLSRIGSRGILVTSKGDDVDFVSRCFFPQSGIDEDPVTGSAHCLLAMYWHERTGRKILQAYQASSRGGYMECEVDGHRILMRGRAVTYLKGEIYCDGA
jgi:PhzF family phenazine biosynthesis protein